MTEVAIVSAARTPIGSFGGSLASITAADLGANAVRAALQRAGVDGSEVSDVIMGHVLTAGCGQLHSDTRQYSAEMHQWWSAEVTNP